MEKNKKFTPAKAEAIFKKEIGKYPDRVSVQFASCLDKEADKALHKIIAEIVNKENGKK